MTNFCLGVIPPATWSTVRDCKFIASASLSPEHLRLTRTGGVLTWGLSFTTWVDVSD